MNSQESLNTLTITHQKLELELVQSTQLANTLKQRMLRAELENQQALISHKGEVKILKLELQQTQDAGYEEAQGQSEQLQECFNTAHQVLQEDLCEARNEILGSS